MNESLLKNYFSLLEISYSEEAKVLKVEFGDKIGEIHIRKFGLVDAGLPDAWIVSDKDVLDIFDVQYMPYLCGFFRDLEQICFINRIKLPVRNMDLRDIAKCDLDGRAYDELISLICR